MQTKSKQVRETLAQSGMKLVERRGNECILLEESGCKSLWVENDTFSGYVVVIDGKGYEFVSYAEV